MTFKRTLGIVCGAVGAALLISSMCATELVRAFVPSEAKPPVALPRGVDIRYSDRLVAVIGRGTPSGRASAITLGYVIVVPTSYRHLPVAARRQLIRHELVHIEQRRRYGRFYLPLYGALYVLRGYTDHPFEREARRDV